MSAHFTKALVIDVTKGDCLIENKKSGTSNTGTYFISSTSNFDEFESYFNLNNTFKISLAKVSIYQTLFNAYYYKYKNEYNGKMRNFDFYCNKLLSIVENPEVDIVLRYNDNRIFMKFADNQSDVSNAFRSILYEDLSQIEIIKKEENTYYIYPVINEQKISNTSCIEIVLEEGK